MSALEIGAARVAYRGLLVAAEAKVGKEDAAVTALYLLNTGAGVPGAIAAKAFGCTKQYVSRIFGEIEMRRDDPTFDAALTELERRIFGEA